MFVVSFDDDADDDGADDAAVLLTHIYPGYKFWCDWVVRCVCEMCKKNHNQPNDYMV